MRQSRAVVIALMVLAAASIFSAELTAQNPNPPNPNGSAPVDATITTFIIPGHPDPLDRGGWCTFDISFSQQGKTKTIILQKSGNFIVTSPDLYATLTNLNDPTKQVIVNVTGSFHISTTSDGGKLFVVTGRNLLGDPVAGLVLAIGDFSFAVDKDGIVTQPLTSQGGTLTDLCALLK